MKKNFKTVLLLVFVIFLCISCAKKEEKELVIYTWEAMFPEEVLDDFTKKTGIKVVYSSFDTNETMLEKLSQADGGTYDLVLGDDYIIDAAIKKGLAQKLDKSLIPTFGNINKFFQGYYYDKENAYTVPYGAGIPVIVYDPAVVNWKITGYQDLWDPRLNDSVAITANYRVINGMALRTMGKGINESDVETIKKGGEKLLALAPNIRLISDDDAHLALLNGEASAAYVYTSMATQVKEANPNLVVVFPKEGLGVGIMDFFIPSKAPHAKAAHEFLAYILDPQVSAKCFNFLGYYCTTKAADPLVNPNLVVPDNFAGEIMQNVPLAADEQYNKNWIEFKAACD